MGRIHHMDPTTARAGWATGERPTRAATTEVCEAARAAIGDYQRSADRVTPRPTELGPAGGGASVGLTATGNLQGGRRAL